MARPRNGEFNRLSTSVDGEFACGDNDTNYESGNVGCAIGMCVCLCLLSPSPYWALACYPYLSLHMRSDRRPVSVSGYTVHRSICELWVDRIAAWQIQS